MHVDKTSSWRFSCTTLRENKIRPAIIEAQYVPMGISTDCWETPSPNFGEIKNPFSSILWKELSIRFKKWGVAFKLINRENGTLVEASLRIFNR
jgi:hypothetical protein